MSKRQKAGLQLEEMKMPRSSLGVDRIRGTVIVEQFGGKVREGEVEKAVNTPDKGRWSTNDIF